MRRFVPIVAAAALLASLAATQAEAQPAAALPVIVPAPQSIQALPGKPATKLRTTTLDKLGVQGPQGLPKGGYVLAIRDGKVALQGADAAGTFYGRQTLRQLKKSKKPLPSLVIRDFPSFALRGGMESFYGNPWPQADLLRHLDWMGAHRMNAFQYTVSGDPRTAGAQWRSLYPAADLARFREAIERANANHIEFIYRINPEANTSPANGICHALPSDLNALVARYQQLYDIGERTFSIGWDDVGGDFVCQLDRDTFGSRPQPLSAAQAHVVNHVYNTFIRTHAGAKLVTVPTDYWDSGANLPRRLAYAQAIPADVPIFWTGPDVISPSITAANLAAAEQSFGNRKLLIFDNYPVNDYAGFHQHLGPLVGRDPALANNALGILANEMQEPEASLLSLYTVAEYAWNPTAYNAQESWTRSLQEFGGSAAGALRDYAEVSLYSPLHPNGAPRLQPLVDAFRQAYRTGGNLTSTGNALLAELARIKPATATLRAMANASFVRDSEPWFVAFDGRVAAAENAVRGLQAQQAGDLVTYRNERRAMGNALSAGSRLGKVLAPGIFDELFDLASGARPGSVLRYDDGRVATFARGTNGQLQWSRQTSEGSTWTAFEAVPGITMTGQPDVILGRNGLPNVFVRGTDGQLWHNWQTSATTWNGWRARGGPISDSPRAIANDDGSWVVFARDTSGALTHLWGTGDSWSALHQIGGIAMQGKPEAFVGRNGALAVFVRGSNNAVWHNWQTGPGTPFADWKNLGGTTVDVPVGAMVANGAQSVFIRTSAGNVATAWQTGEGSDFSAFQQLGTLRIWGEPTVAVNNANAMSLYVRGDGNGLWTSWQNLPGDSLAGFVPVGLSGTITSTPRLAESRRGGFSLYALQGSSMATAWQWGPGSGWAGWANLGGSLTP
ncbi:beta-N-acetylglucosaminidase domain-containing protein [Tenggerimyces flavus]|uniref:Beta-N-acetylglucosaminidase domain-containing protein n=1 Tax=Tenggerimyces flavus TaxID=1708749 RepID=A0ABV7YL13_9ACTN|nr:beta-N-acetylglucosaminidase domain-containing protein [Tenggerimyces flavus]MBM7784780.1 hypothetical protein [Tenggerimyces flavus]